MSRRPALLPPLLAAGCFGLGLLTIPGAHAITITPTITTDGDHFDYDYVVTDDVTNSADSIMEILIPELHAGDLTAATLPTGWTASELTATPNIMIPGHTVAKELELITNIPADEVPANGGSLEFDLTSAYGGTLSSNWQVLDHAGGPHINGISIPDSSQPLPTPEPASLGLLAVGFAALARMRRRGRRISGR